MSFDLQPILRGRLIELRPLRPEDYQDLYAVASHPLTWEQHPALDRYGPRVFQAFIREALDSGDLERTAQQLSDVFGRDVYSCRCEAGISRRPTVSPSKSNSISTAGSFPTTQPSWPGSIETIWGARNSTTQPSGYSM